ncbi:MAG: hypothetical protein GF364_03975 [Candidatus Lokiarchaeota archaeon]|nr:hypothetical protein [Candidatus Lokiarchaeota archaeon]
MVHRFRDETNGAQPQIIQDLIELLKKQLNKQLKQQMGMERITLTDIEQLGRDESAACNFSRYIKGQNQLFTSLVWAAKQLKKYGNIDKTNGKVTLNKQLKNTLKKLKASAEKNGEKFKKKTKKSDKKGIAKKIRELTTDFLGNPNKKGFKHLLPVIADNPTDIWLELFKDLQNADKPPP